MPLREENKELFELAVGVFLGEVPYETIRLVWHMMEEDPNYWWTPHHFSWGMSIRNLFRSRVCLDDQLPVPKNWDDHYIEVIESAIKRHFLLDESNKGVV